MEQGKGARKGACAAEFTLNCESKCPIKPLTEQIEANSGYELREILKPILDQTGLALRDCIKFSGSINDPTP